MNVLHIIHSLDPRSGGPVESLHQLVSAQSALGMRVTVVYTHSGKASQQIEERWIPICACVAGFRGVGRQGILRRFRFVPRLRGKLRPYIRRANVVHVHGLFSHISIAACALARKAGRPYILRPAGGLGTFSMAHGNQLGKRLLFAVSVRRDLRRAAFVHATSAREKHEIDALRTGATVEVVPHGIAIPQDHELIDARTEYRSAFPAFAGERYFLFLSRLHRKKGVLLLIRAFARASSRIAHHLVIAGPDAGEEHPARALAASLGVSHRVHFAGHLEGAVKLGAFAGADAFVLPSRDENFGVAVIEAMAAGCVVIVTPGVDASQYVAASGCGMIVPRSAGALADCLAEMASADLREMGAAGRLYAAKWLSSGAVALRLTESYAAIQG